MLGLSFTYDHRVIDGAWRRVYEIILKAFGESRPFLLLTAKGPISFKGKRGSS
jgi:pyruvate/2-oxoglutarate dehydrogenase complex dihydrolipoamide acyltransferase (E2) component